MQVGHLTIDSEELAAFCRRWKIAELSVFGSVLRDDFRPDSDVDFLVSFEPGEHWTLGDLVDLRHELASLIGHDVDIVERPAVVCLSNPFRRRHILATARELYVA